MKNFSLTILLGFGVLGLAGCPGNANNSAGNNANVKMSNGNMMVNSNQAVVINSNTATMNSNANMNKSTGSMNAPADFIPEAARGGMAEIELSKVALKNSQNKEVKDFAQKMVTDHTKAGDELKAVAAKKSITLPTEPDAEHKTKMADSMKMTGADFDKQYVETMVADHEKTVALLKDQSENGTDADVKAWAAKTLPIVESHTTMIKAIQAKMK